MLEGRSHRNRVNSTGGLRRHRENSSTAGHERLSTSKVTWSNSSQDGVRRFADVLRMRSGSTPVQHTALADAMDIEDATNLGLDLRSGDGTSRPSVDSLGAMPDTLELRKLAFQRHGHALSRRQLQSQSTNRDKRPMSQQKSPDSFLSPSVFTPDGDDGGGDPFGIGRLTPLSRQELLNSSENDFEDADVKMRSQHIALDVFGGSHHEDTNAYEHDEGRGTSSDDIDDSVYSSSGSSTSRSGSDDDGRPLPNNLQLPTRMRTATVSAPSPKIPRDAQIKVRLWLY